MSDDINPADYFSGLEGDLSARPATRPAPEEQRFPCMSCGGTGRWQRCRTNRMEQNHCFACGGKGYHKRPHAETMRAKAQARVNREEGVRRAQERRLEAFEEANPGLIEWMRQQTWSTFLQDMVARVATPYGLSERQLAAVYSTKAKQDERREQRQVERRAAEVEVDLSAIEAMFDTARGNGLRRPTYRAEGLVISAAPAAGRNAGALYVKAAEGDAYLGKIVNRVFQPTWEARQAGDVGARLLSIAVNPLEAAVRYGRLIGACSCCGRQLVDPVSVERGIGPICAEKWGL